MPSPNRFDVYDQDSGLVYNERVVHVPRRRKNAHGHLDYDPKLRWFYGARGQRPKYSEAAQGSPTLEDLAWRSLLNNLSSLTPEVLGSLPESWIDKIWMKVVKAQLNSLYLWQIFVPHLSPKTSAAELATQEQFMTLSSLDHLASSRASSHESRANEDSSADSLKVASRLRSSVIKARSSDELLPLGSYLSRINSPSHDFDVVLFISNLAVPITEMMSIFRLSNLVSLHIESGREYKDRLLDDRMIRTWAEHASNTGCLPSLKNISLKGQQGITKMVFAHLRSFKTLTAFCVSDCGIYRMQDCFSSAREEGWALTQPEKEASSDEIPRLIFKLEGHSEVRYGPRSSLKLHDEVLRFRRIEGWIKGEGKGNGKVDAKGKEEGKQEGEQKGKRSIAGSSEERPAKKRMIKEGKKLQLGGVWAGLV